MRWLFRCWMMLLIVSLSFAGCASGEVSLTRLEKIENKTDADADVPPKVSFDTDADLSLRQSWTVADLLALPERTPVRVRTVLDGFVTTDLAAVLVGFSANPITGDTSDPYLLLETDPADTRWALMRGAAAGMSGSPIIIQERHAGALSFSVFDTDDPFLFIGTPIEPMSHLANEGETFLVDASPNRLEPMTVLSATSNLGSWALPEVQERMREIFYIPDGLDTFAGGSYPQSAPSSLEEGSAIAVGLVVGDMVNIEGIGTVTAVDGKQVLAFGHPMTGIGPVAYPFRAAHVEAVSSNAAFGSYKIASGVGPVLGTILEDRFHGIAGQFGTFRPLLKIHTDVKSGGQMDFYRHQAVWTAMDPYMSAHFASFAATWPAEVVRGYSGAGTAFYSGTISIEESPDLLVFGDVATSAFSPLFDAYLRLYDDLYEIVSVQGFTITPMSLQMQLEVTDQRREYQIAQVTSENVVVPGQDYAFTVSFAAFGSDPPESHALSLFVPEDFTPIAAVLVVSAQRESFTEQVGYSNVKEFVEAFNARSRSDTIEVRLIPLGSPPGCEPCSECETPCAMGGEYSGSDAYPDVRKSFPERGVVTGYVERKVEVVSSP